MVHFVLWLQQNTRVLFDLLAWKNTSLFIPKSHSENRIKNIDFWWKYIQKQVGFFFIAHDVCVNIMLVHLGPRSTLGPRVVRMWRQHCGKLSINTTLYFLRYQSQRFVCWRPHFVIYSFVKRK